MSIHSLSEHELIDRLRSGPQSLDQIAAHFGVTKKAARDAAKLVYKSGQVVYEKNGTFRLADWGKDYGGYSGE